MGACGPGCGIWDLVPPPGMVSGPVASGTWSPSHWTTREFPEAPDFILNGILFPERGLSEISQSPQFELVSKLSSKY